MLPKPVGLPLRTEKVQTAGVFTLKSIVSRQMGPLQWSSSRGCPQLSISLCHPGLCSSEHFTGSWCCYCSFWKTLDLGSCVWVFGLSFPGGFLGFYNTVSNKEVSFHSNRHSSSHYPLPVFFSLCSLKSTFASPCLSWTAMFLHLLFSDCLPWEWSACDLAGLTFLALPVKILCDI